MKSNLHHQWTDEDMRYLRDAWTSGVPTPTIVETLGRSIRSIRIQASRTGLERKRAPMTEEARAIRSRATKGKPRGPLSEDHKKKMRAYKLSWWADEQNREKAMQWLPRAGEIGRERAAELRRGGTTWNKGMRPWEWMRMTEAEFYKMLADSQKRRPTRPEVEAGRICGAMGLPWKYVGDGSLWIGGKNPDFVWPERRVALEIFGRYWHDASEVDSRAAAFAKHGWRCVVLWEDEVTEEKLQFITKLAMEEK